MLKAVIAGLIGAVAFTNVAMATCTAPANGYTADATLLTTYLSCQYAPLDSPHFTGSVGIGTTTPANTLSVVGSLAVGDGTAVPGTDRISITNSDPTFVSSVYAVNDIGTEYLTFSMYGSTVTSTIFGLPRAHLAALQTGTTNTGPLVIGTRNSANLYFGTNGQTRLTVDTSGHLGIGTTTPAQALEVVGKVQVDSFGSATSAAVCQLAGVLSSCSSSIRYKENVQNATFGLSEVEQMRPVTFKWKGRDENDFGLVAEDVAKINPAFATYKDGKVEGVKYAQLTAVLANAIKELKSANDAQAAQIVSLQSQVSKLQTRVAGSAAASDNRRRRTALLTNAR